MLRTTLPLIAVALAAGPASAQWHRHAATPYYSPGFYSNYFPGAPYPVAWPYGQPAYFAYGYPHPYNLGSGVGPQFVPGASSMFGNVGNSVWNPTSGPGVNNVAPFPFAGSGIGVRDNNLPNRWEVVSNIPKDAAVLSVRVPENAEVWVDGVKTTTKGAVREYVSPKLTADKPYVYEVQARWPGADGQPINETQKATVSAGVATELTFPTPLDKRQ